MDILRTIRNEIAETEDEALWRDWQNLIDDLFFLHGEDIQNYGHDLLSDINHWLDGNEVKPFWYGGDEHAYREAMNA